jgi:hypothetical protein
MNAPVDHHFIPAFFLSQWAGDTGKLIEYAPAQRALGLVGQAPRALSRPRERSAWRNVSALNARPHNIGIAANGSEHTPPIEQINGHHSFRRSQQLGHSGRPDVAGRDRIGAPARSRGEARLPRRDNFRRKETVARRPY